VRQGRSFEVCARGGVEVQGLRCAIAEILVELLETAVVDGLLLDKAGHVGVLRVSYARAKEEKRYAKEEGTSRHRCWMLGVGR
jgi:hypothetical protein